MKSKDTNNTKLFICIKKRRKEITYIKDKKRNKLFNKKSKKNHKIYNEKLVCVFNQENLNFNNSNKVESFFNKKPYYKFSKYQDYYKTILKYYKECFNSKNNFESQDFYRTEHHSLYFTNVIKTVSKEIYNINNIDFLNE